MNRTLTWIAAVGFLAGCATTPIPPEERDPRDPWEAYNREAYKFNSEIDRRVIRPVAKGYQTVTPPPLQRGISNFFTNIRSPVDIANLLLQGRPADAGTQLKRFFVNTVYGIGGLFDVASAGDIEHYSEDFGQTMATWGWEESRFVILPLLGPATIRDGTGRIVDSGTDVLTRLAVEETSLALVGLNVIQGRVSMFPLDEQIEAAFDPYVYVRDGWLQRREFQISNGENTIPDYDSFLEDGDDW